MKNAITFSPPNSRWQQSSKSSTLSNKETPTGAKADALREEMEEAANRMEICRVGGAYHFLSAHVDYFIHTVVHHICTAYYKNVSMDVCYSRLTELSFSFSLKCVSFLM